MGGPLTRVGLLALVLSAALSYGLSGSARRVEACGLQGPFEFDTYEPENYVAVYNRAIELAAEGKAVPFSYTIGPTADSQVDVTYQGLTSGPRKARLAVDKNLRVPPSIYKSIAWIESNWSNAAGTVPYGGVGPILRSFDCGYGLGQVTSGMANNSGYPSARQAIIGTQFLFNLAEGVRILADKWNQAPNFRPVAGNGDPAALEDWYFAIWSYNGFAAINDPTYDSAHQLEWKDYTLNPLKPALRGGVYHCGDSSAPNYFPQESGSPKYGYGDYTYTERVYGCMRYPPFDKQGNRMWTPQVFSMPDLSIEAVASAFAPANFISCDEFGFNPACVAKMDYPTTIPEKNVVTHKDSTPPADAASSASLLGDPQFHYEGSPNALIVANSDGTVTAKSAITVSNVGLGIAPFRIRTSADWIVVRHDTDPLQRKSLNAGVAVGQDKDVVTQAPLRGQQRIAQKGMDSRLVITINPAKMPKGVSYGTVFIEPLLGSGGVFQVNVVGVKGFDYRIVIPSLSVGP